MCLIILISWAFSISSFFSVLQNCLWVLSSVLLRRIFVAFRPLCSHERHFNVPQIDGCKPTLLRRPEKKTSENQRHFYVRKPMSENQSFQHPGKWRLKHIFPVSVKFILRRLEHQYFLFKKLGNIAKNLTF